MQTRPAKLPEDADRLQEALVKLRAISHEINQPIQIILGHAELMIMQTKPGDAMRDDLTTIRDQADRLASINQRLHKVAILQD